MLEPQSRAALTEQLTPPSGYELAHAVGTSFTLDLATALAVPLSFASHRVSADRDTLGVLDAIRRASDRIDIFAQAGELSMGAASDLVAFLEPMIHPVLPRRGLFHPKIWFLEYRAGDELAYRFLCASRNLTGDRSWDVLVRLDGRPAEAGVRRASAAVNRPLVSLLRRLPDLCVQPMPELRRQNVLTLAERWRTVAWEAPDGMRKLAFHVLGIPGAESPEIAGQRALVISPFVSDEGLALLRSRVRTDTHLISRAESLDRLRQATLDAKLKTYVLDDAATLAEDAAEANHAPVPVGNRLSGLHAKAIVVDRGDGSHVFLGSANATGAAWHDNIEVMVELVGSLGSVGVEATLRALGDLKDEYPTEGGQERSEDEHAEWLLEEFMRKLAGVRLTVRVVGAEPYGLRVWRDGNAASSARFASNDRGRISVRWHLLTRADLGDDVLVEDEDSASEIHDVPLTDITPFVVLVGRDTEGRERRTIVVARLLDDVPARRDAIIARQLTDRAAFVRLLTLLLELSGVGMPAISGAGEYTFFGAGQGDSAGAGLFEALVRAVGASHGGLADARRIIDFVREHGDENAVLPHGFEELWASVWEAHIDMVGPIA